ncbi:MAG: N-acetylmuramoyl-L-alanine amidase [Chloroflexus sp.]|uniref:peptidoglycan recognition protein family protein n=1 Tax=Chloroflexus sp. TaxID=1904827 RepID=UPI0021DD36F0|nr:peptidoglycan recognition family protein [Chloroflexus sp.]GIV89857.1 MAG: N-acetylmuramoyl-L-alanine amidase [Chloroflexus sp.]
MPDFPTEGSPPFINRMLTIAEWRDYVAKYDFGRLAPSRLVLHHTYRPDETTWRGLTTMRGIQKFYAGKGWTAGPHIFAAPDGIWLATPMSQIGIHAGTGNGSLTQGWYSIGLEMVGYFDKVLPSGKVWEHSVAVMGELSRRLKIPPRQLISFHRDYTNQKSCPGWAVTKEWVWSQVEAYLNNTTPPPPSPPGPIGDPTPDEERLIEALLEEGYKPKTNGQGYNADWAFHQYALEHQLGMPMGPSTRITVGGKVYNYQPFARDTLYCEVPNWGDVKTLSDLLGGSIPPNGLGRALLEATYQAGGSPFRPDWAFHQYAVINRLGPPVGKSAQITVDGKQYAYQAFAVDTLYNLVPNWQDVHRLSQLTATDPATVKLRDALLTETYRQAGTTYRPDWAFHQLARQWAIGVPLANSYQIIIEKTTYALQPFALDVLYNVVPKWSEVKRLSELARRYGMPILGVAMAAPVVEIPRHALTPPSDGDFTITQITPPARAFGERNGERVSMVVLHAIPSPVEEIIAAMTDFNARFATHYLIGLDGRIYRLVDEAKAAWHAGFATGGGTRYNLNRISIGIALERPAGWPATRDAGDTDAQVRALRWLLRQLDGRYRLDPDAIVLWSSLAGSDEEALAGLPLGALREALMG